MEVAAAPLHHVVVADRAFVKKTAAAIQVSGSGTPGFLGCARGAAEAPVVVGQEMAEDLVGGLEIGGRSQAQFTRETILESAPKEFDAPLGLGRVGGDVSDAELCQCSTELGRLSFTGELLRIRWGRVA